MPWIPRILAACTRPWVTGRMVERLVVREEPVCRREERWSRSLLSQSGRRREEVRETQEEGRRERRKGLDRRSRSRGRDTVESEVITGMVGEEEEREEWEEERWTVW